MLYLGAILLALLSSITYHLLARAIPPGVHPLITLLVTYLSAALLCLLLLPLFPLTESLSKSVSHVNWTSVGLAVAIVGIEAGFLLAYRAGWKISLADLVVNAGATAALIPVGVLAFREKLSLAQVAGLVLCVVGLMLINKR